MPRQERDKEALIRERAYYLWERDGKPHGQDQAYWHRAATEQSRSPKRARRSVDDDDPTPDEERIMDGRIDVNYPALLTRDVPGG